MMKSDWGFSPLPCHAVQRLSHPITGEAVAIVHGLEEDEIAQGRKRSLIPYVHADIVIRRNGKWQIAASQLARPVEAQAER